jgi:Ni/Fe-hydrogenase subunit HybB-like protein
VAVNLAAIGKRFLIVVPSLTKGSLLPYEPGVYSPTLVEIGVVLGLFALGALLMGLFAKAFPIMELADDDRMEVETGA